MYNKEPKSNVIYNKSMHIRRAIANRLGHNRLDDNLFKNRGYFFFFCKKMQTFIKIM